MLKLLATAAVLLALTPQWVDSTTTAISHSKLKGHVLMKVGCVAPEHWGAITAEEFFFTISWQGSTLLASGPLHLNAVQQQINDMLVLLAVEWIGYIPKHSHILTTNMVLYCTFLHYNSICKSELVGREAVYLQVSTRSVRHWRKWWSYDCAAQLAS